jgi:hypothetical protein
VPGRCGWVGELFAVTAALLAGRGVSALGLVEEGAEDAEEGDDEGHQEEGDGGHAPEGGVAGGAGLRGDVGEGEHDGDEGEGPERGGEDVKVASHGARDEFTATRSDKRVAILLLEHGGTGSCRD